MIDTDSLPIENPRLHFAGAFRLHTAAEFSRVFASRNKLRGKYFDLHYLASHGDHNHSERNLASIADTGDTSTMASARLGLVVAKKLARRAVQRNLLKRLSREAFRHVRGRLPHYDLVLRLARSPGAGLRQDWRDDVDQLLQRLIDRSAAPQRNTINQALNPR